MRIIGFVIWIKFCLLLELIKINKIERLKKISPKIIIIWIADEAIVHVATAMRTYFHAIFLLLRESITETKNKGNNAYANHKYHCGIRWNDQTL
jgi:hypothetical protein